MKRITNAQFLRQCLINAGERGIVFADTFRRRKGNDVIYHKGTYASYIKLSQVLKRLGWIEATGEKETAYSRSGSYELKQPRTYYKITPEGLAHSEQDWSNPLCILYPKSSH